MGLYFNSKATTKLQAAVNDRFSHDSISDWRPANPGDPSPMDYFNGSSAGSTPTNPKTLYDIAKFMKVFAGAQDSKEDKRFQKWLKYLHTTSVGDTIRQYIYQGLSDDANCAEIDFVLIPSSAVGVGAPTPAGDPGGYTWVIPISTQEVDKIPNPAPSAKPKRGGSGKGKKAKL
jgi:hypothetical protein